MEGEINERREWGGYYKEREGGVGGRRAWERDGRERGRKGVWRVRRMDGVREGITKAGREGWREGGRVGGIVERRK